MTSAGTSPTVEPGNVLIHSQACVKPSFAAFREGDVRNSLADIGKARNLLGYEPTHSVKMGMDETLRWYNDQSLAKARLSA